jgi:hypothetical protein
MLSSRAHAVEPGPCCRAGGPRTRWFPLLTRMVPGSNAPRAGSLPTRALLFYSRRPPRRRGTAGRLPDVLTRLPPAPASEARREGSRAASRPAVLAVTRMSVARPRVVRPQHRLLPERRWRQPTRASPTPAADPEPRAPAPLSDRSCSGAHPRVRRGADGTMRPTPQTAMAGPGPKRAPEPGAETAATPPRGLPRSPTASQAAHAGLINRRPRLTLLVRAAADRM